MNGSDFNKLALLSTVSNLSSKSRSTFSTILYDLRDLV